MSRAGMSKEEIASFITDHFPAAARFGAVIETATHHRMTLRLPVAEMHLRPGGTVSGPSLMTLADTAFYYLLLATLGPVPLAVTTHLSIDFLRRPLPADVIADAELLKLGRRLAVGRVTMRSVGSEEPVAHATLTYSIPPAEDADRESPVGGADR